MLPRLDLDSHFRRQIPPSCYYLSVRAQVETGDFKAGAHQNVWRSVAIESF